MTLHRWLSLAAVLLPLTLSACGGQQPSSPPPTVSAPPSSPPPSTPVVTQSRQPAGAATTRGVGTTSGARKRALPDAPPSQQFEVGTDIPNFELVPATDPRSGALVSLVAPPIGLDSTTVTLAAAPPAASATAGPRQPRTGGAPAGFSVVAEAGFAEDGLPLRLRCEKDGSDMTLVPSGLFLQGEDGAEPNVAPLHPVELSGFYIDVREVTLGQYQKYWKEARPVPGRAANVGGADDLPAVGINWRDASGYLTWVGKELPTEAEWEKAARGPDTFASPWGNGRVLWHRPRTPQQIDPVGSFPSDRSIYGAFDLAGNAREWCADLYADDAYRQAAGATGAVVTDPVGPKAASPPGHRVVRGNAPGWQLWQRASSPMLAPADDIGFRGVLHWPATQGSGTAGTTDSSEPPPTVAPRRGRGK